HRQRRPGGGADLRPRRGGFRPALLPRNAGPGTGGRRDLPRRRRDGPGDGGAPVLRTRPGGAPRRLAPAGGPVRLGEGCGARGKLDPRPPWRADLGELPWWGWRESRVVRDVQDGFHFTPPGQP